MAPASTVCCVEHQVKLGMFKLLGHARPMVCETQHLISIHPHWCRNFKTSNCLLSISVQRQMGPISASSCKTPTAGGLHPKQIHYRQCLRCGVRIAKWLGWTRWSCLVDGVDVILLSRAGGACLQQWRRQDSILWTHITYPLCPNVFQAAEPAGQHGCLLARLGPHKQTEALVSAPLDSSHK